MSLRDEVRDPWSYVIAGLAGGLAWAVVPASIVAAPVAAGVGAVVFGAKVIAGAFARPEDRPRRRREPRLPVVAQTDEARWLARAENAQRSFEDIARSASEGPVAERVASFGSETDDALASLQRLAGQASAVRLALGRLDLRRLHWERDRLREAQRTDADPAVVAERGRALAAVESQLEAYGRLASALTTLLARLESGAIGLEGLVARLSEVVALTATTGASDGVPQLDDLATELEGLRAGLVEAEGVSSRAIEGLAPLSSPSPGSGSVPGSTPARGRATE
jgi:hypothetical protein